MLIHVVQGEKQGRTYIIFAATPQSPETRALLGLFRVGAAAGSQEVVSVGLWMMPRVLRVAAPRVRRANRAHLRRH